MAIINNDETPKEIYYYRKCPQCGSKVHVERKYCGCGYDMANCPHYASEFPQKLEFGRVNFSVRDYSCDVCGANCDYCASFSVPRKNQYGFGGKDCGHKGDLLRCTCCQLLIKNREKYPIDQAIRESMTGIQKIFERRCV